MFSYDRISCFNLGSYQLFLTEGSAGQLFGGISGTLLACSAVDCCQLTYLGLVFGSFNSMINILLFIYGLVLIFFNFVLLFFLKDMYLCSHIVFNWLFVIIKL